MGQIGLERDGIAHQQFMNFRVDANTQCPPQHHDDLLRSGRVWLGRVRGTRRQTELVSLDPAAFSRRNERPALQEAVF